MLSWSKTVSRPDTAIIIDYEQGGCKYNSLLTPRNSLNLPLNLGEIRIRKEIVHVADILESKDVFDRSFRQNSTDPTRVSSRVGRQAAGGWEA